MWTRHLAMIRNKEQGSNCLTMQIEWETNSCLPMECAGNVQFCGPFWRNDRLEAIKAVDFTDKMNTLEEWECPNNPNRLKYHLFLLRECIKCDYVIKGTSKWERKRCPGSHTRWLGVPGQEVSVREVRGSNPGGTTHYCSPISCQIGLARKSVQIMLTTCKNMHFFLKSVRSNTNFYYS